MDRSVACAFDDCDHCCWQWKVLINWNRTLSWVSALQIRLNFTSHADASDFCRDRQLTRVMSYWMKLLCNYWDVSILLWLDRLEWSRTYQWGGKVLMSEHIFHFSLLGFSLLTVHFTFFFLHANDGRCWWDNMRNENDRRAITLRKKVLNRQQSKQKHFLTLQSPLIQVAKLDWFVETRKTLKRKSKIMLMWINGFYQLLGYIHIYFIELKARLD